MQKFRLKRKFLRVDKEDKNFRGARKMPRFLADCWLEVILSFSTQFCLLTSNPWDSLLLLIRNEVSAPEAAESVTCSHTKT